MTNYSTGAKGDAVKQIQTALNNAGYSLAVDGSFGPKTLAAVKDYQSKNGLTVDGIVGSHTWGSLFKTNSATPAATTPAATTPAAATTDYRKLAEQQYDPSYNANVTAIKNALAQKVAAYDASKGDVNLNYDRQVENQNNNNVLAQNNFNNITNSRGLGRSSILSTGLASMDVQNNKLVNDINQSRTNALGSIEASKLADTNATNDTLTTMAGDRESALQALMRSLQDADWTKNFQQQQFDFQKQNAAQQLQLQQQQLAAQIKAAARSSASSRNPLDDAYKQVQIDIAKKQLEQMGKPSSSDLNKSLTNDAWSSFYKAIDQGIADDWLSSYRDSLISDIGASAYSQMLSEWRQYQKQNENYY